MCAVYRGVNLGHNIDTCSSCGHTYILDISMDFKLVENWIHKRIVKLETECPECKKTQTDVMVETPKD